MPPSASDSRTSFRHHPVQDAKPLLVTDLLDQLALASAHRVGNAHRLLRRVQAIELSFVVHEDLLEPARVKAAYRPRASIPDRREVPAIAEMATELRLAALGLAPFVSELPVAEPLLAAELRTRRVLRRSQGEKFLQVRLELWLGPRLVDFFLGLLLGFFLLALLLFRRLRFLLRLLFAFLLHLRRRGLLLFRRGLLRGPFLDECAKALPEIVDLPFLTQAIPFGPGEEFGLLRGADFAGRRQRLLRLRRLRDGRLLGLLRRFHVGFRLLLFGHLRPPRPSS